MRIIADLHIHSRYSRGTSRNMNLKEIEYYGKIKGLNIIGTGDFTHPKWYQELKDKLYEKEGSGLYAVRNSSDSVLFILSCEVATFFSFNGRIKKIHHLILTPNLDVAEDLIERLSSFGDLKIDGRPILNITAVELVEIVRESSKMNLIIPAHVWTPWFSLFGSNSGFNSIQECYQDLSDQIFALETGLSSDPPMNWRLTTLDKYTLVSNSDSHSAWPWRIGREANVFTLDKITYQDLIETIKSGDQGKFLYTIETYPQYGKYHWTGHRNCGVSLSPKLSMKYNNMCPKCGKKMTIGVEQRVVELADRESDDVPSNRIGYKYIISLPEIIANISNLKSIYSNRVWDQYNLLIRRFENEFNVLLDAPIREIGEVGGQKLAYAIKSMRENNVVLVPGYDGVYGRVKFNVDPWDGRFRDPYSSRQEKTGLWKYI